MIPHTCRAKEIWDLSQAESVEDAVEQVLLGAGGRATLGPRLLVLVEDLEDQLSADQIGHAAVFAFCDVQLTPCAHRVRLSARGRLILYPQRCATDEREISSTCRSTPSVQYLSHTQLTYKPDGTRLDQDCRVEPPRRR